MYMQATEMVFTGPKGRKTSRRFCGSIYDRFELRDIPGHRGTVVLFCLSDYAWRAGQVLQGGVRRFFFFFTPEICRQLVLQEKPEITIKGSSSFCYVLADPVSIYPVVFCVQDTSRWIGFLLISLGGISTGHKLNYSQSLHKEKYPLWLILTYSIWSLMDMHKLRFLNFPHTLEFIFLLIFFIIFSLLKSYWRRVQKS